MLVFREILSTYLKDGPLNYIWVYKKEKNRKKYLPQPGLCRRKAALKIPGKQFCFECYRLWTFDQILQSKLRAFLK